MPCGRGRIWSAEPFQHLALISGLLARRRAFGNRPRPAPAFAHSWHPFPRHQRAGIERLNDARWNRVMGEITALPYREGDSPGLRAGCHLSTLRTTNWPFGKLSRVAAGRRRWFSPFPA